MHVSTPPIDTDARTHRPKPLIVISLVAQVTKGTVTPTDNELRDEYPFIHWGDSVANYPYGWHNKRVELLIIDASNKWKRTSLRLSSPHLASAGRDPLSREAYLAVADAGDINGDGKHEIVCGVTLDTDDSFLLSYSRTSHGWKPTLITEFGRSLSFIRSLSVGDVNRDGVDEIVVGGRPHGHVVLLEPAKHRETVLEHGLYGEGTTNTREVLIASVADGTNVILATIARQDAAKWAATPGSLLLFTHRQTGWTRRVIDDFDNHTHSRMIRVGHIKGRDPWIVANEVGVLDATQNRTVRASSMIMYRIENNRIHKNTIDTLPFAIKSRGFACGDIDGDGQEELIVGTRSLDIPGYGKTFLLMYKYDHKNGTWLKEVIARSNTDLGFHCVEAIDVDGDGQDEIIASEDARGLIRMYKHINGTWATTVVARYPYRLFVTKIFGLAKEST